MPMRLSILLSAVLLTVAVPGQNYHVPDNQANAGTCNVIPFGYSPLSPYSQSRFQMKATAADLGNMTNIVTGLGFAPCLSGAARYDSIEIVLDHHPAGVPLGTNFASNLTPAAVTVLAIPDHVWHLTADTWCEIGLQDFFVYNGVDDLVIQITTVGGAAPGGFYRGSRQRVYWTASTGTAPATGTAGIGAIKFEVSMLTGDVSRYGEGCAGGLGAPVHTLSGTGQLNTTVDLDLHNGRHYALAGLIMGFSNGWPYPVDLASMGMPGCLQYIDVVSVLATQLDVQGTTSIPLLIPNNTQLLARRLYSQFACLDPSANVTGVSTSGYGRIHIGN